MKSIANILLFCFITLTVAPASVTALNYLKAKCKTECMMAEDGETCPITDMECCPGMCNPTQCCFCCFICTVDNKKLEIEMFGSSNTDPLSDERFALSDFSSDRWQPPKFV